MLGLQNPFRRKRKQKLHFALVVSDRPTDGFQFTPDRDCKMFMFTGEVIKGDVIPRSTLRAAVEKFDPSIEQMEGHTKISESQNGS